MRGALGSRLAGKVRSKRGKNGRRYPWEHLPQRELLSLRLCDLNLSIEGTWLEDRIARVRDELAKRDLNFNPHFWLSDEWFSPTGIPGVALPFYLAHPRLIRLERSQMFEAEGATGESCMRLLRHELGHAIQHAYHLQRRREWQRQFGKASTPYPTAYRPNPASRRFVHNLDAWYAQSHPEEDFAETFAVWLRPRFNWRRRYEGWPALRKLDYVERLMQELAGKPPGVRSRAQLAPLSRQRTTLRAYYEKKRAHYAVGFTDAYDRDLKRLFSEAEGASDRRETAAAFLTRHRREIRNNVAKWTGEYQLTLDQTLDQMIGRCKQLRLMADGKERNLVLDFAIMLTVHGMNYVYRGREWHIM